MGAELFDVTATLIVVDATVYGPDPNRTVTLPMAVDTGASSTLISPDVAFALGYDPAVSPDRRRIVTGSGIEYASMIRVEKLCAIGEFVDDLDVLCHDLPDQSRVDGLLGLSFFRHFDLGVLFSRGALELTRIA